MARILSLPNELLDRILALVFDADPTIRLLEAAQDNPRHPPPSRHALDDLVAVAATCRRFHPIAGPYLYRSVLIRLPHKPMRIHRLLRTFNEHPDALALCKRLYVDRITGNMAGEEIAVLLAERALHEHGHGRIELAEAQGRLRDLWGLMDGEGTVVWIGGYGLWWEVEVGMLRAPAGVGGTCPSRLDSLEEPEGASKVKQVR